MTTKTRRHYSPDFEREAVELVGQPGQMIAGITDPDVIRKKGLHRDTSNRPPSGYGVRPVGRHSS